MQKTLGATQKTVPTPNRAWPSNDIMKVRDVLKILQKDGWSMVRTSGSHRVLKHPVKRGIVVVAGRPGKELAPGTLKSVWKQAQLEDRK